MSGRNVWSCIQNLEKEVAELRTIVEAVKADVDELSGKAALDFPIPPFPRTLKALGYKPPGEPEVVPEPPDAPFERPTTAA